VTMYGLSCADAVALGRRAATTNAAIARALARVVVST